MGYATDYLAMVDALINRLKTAPELTNLQEVVLGEKTQIGAVKFPAVFVVPASDQITAAAANIQEHTYTIEVVVLQKKHDMQQGLREVIQLAGQCYDVILQDRTLNNTCADVAVTSIQLDYQRAEAFVLHWALLTVQAKRLRRG